VDYLRKGRYDYFLIWGNGMPYKEEILDIIRSKEFLKILRIMGYGPTSIARFVRKVYSYDYAPFEHLKAKTRYLLKTEPDVTLILVRNESPREVYRGQGAFRHIECERIKSMKEEIRNRFNPRKNGKRTEEHVVHASDNEAQVDNMLKIFGFKDGIEFLRNVPNPILSLPYYLPKFEEFTIRCVSSSQVYCNILRGTRESFRKETVQIEETPHFAFLTGDMTSYAEYLSKFMGGPLTCDYSAANFVALSKNLAYLEHPYATSYILMREVQPNQYLILDGVHRAAILKFRGVDNFAVAVME
jgi:hypothetical protein